MELFVTVIGWLLKAMLALVLTAALGTMLVVALYVALVLIGLAYGVVLVAGEMRKEAVRVDTKITVDVPAQLHQAEAVIPFSRTRSVTIERPKP